MFCCLTASTARALLCMADAEFLIQVIVEPHTESVALMLAPEAHAALIGWEPVNSRIITAKFTTKKKDIRTFLYISFIDYEKAFDSVDRETMWKLLRHYGVPKKIISLIRCTFQDMSCRIAHAGRLSESFEVKPGVGQGYLLSPFPFLLVINWIMKATTTGRNNGIQWTPWTQLDDLDFTDDLALL